jgi:hypothetical protein
MSSAPSRSFFLALYVFSPCQFLLFVLFVEFEIFLSVGLFFFWEIFNLFNFYFQGVSHFLFSFSILVSCSKLFYQILYPMCFVLSFGFSGLHFIGPFLIFDFFLVFSFPQGKYAFNFLLSSPLSSLVKSSFSVPDHSAFFLFSFFVFDVVS